MEKYASITKEMEYKLQHIREEAFSHFKDFVFQNGTEEMKGYSQKQLRDIFFHQKYTLTLPEYDKEDGLEYQCMVTSL